jgi:hypothetical protein
LSNDRIVDDGEILHLTNNIMGIGRDACSGVQDYIIADDGIGHGINSLSAIPHHVSFNGVNGCATAIDKNTRELRAAVRIMNHIMPNNVPGGPDFDFDPVVSTRRAFTEMMDVVSLNHTVRDAAATGVAAEIKPFSFGASRSLFGVVDMVGAETS